MSTEIDLSPAAVLKTVQEMRMHILLDGRVIDKDQLLLMRDLANTSLRENQIMVEEGGVKAQKELAEALAHLVTGARSNPFEFENDVVELKKIDIKDLPEFEISEDELSTEQSTLNHEEFVAKRAITNPRG